MTDKANPDNANPFELDLDGMYERYLDVSHVWRRAGVARRAMGWG